MNKTKFFKMLEMAKSIGLRTFADLQEFKKREQERGYDLFEMLQNYTKEMGVM